MYAIIKDGGHQYRVEQGQRLRVQARPAGPGESITFDQVCLVAGDGGDPQVGTPFLEGARVEGRVVRPRVKGRKLDVFFFRRRKGSRRKLGHRQSYTEVEITDISA